MAGPQRRTGLAMAILPAITAFTLAACGGGGGGGGPVVKKQFIEVEDTVSPSPTNLSGFVVSQTPSYVLGLVGADATGVSPASWRPRITGTGATGAAFPTILSCWGSACITEAAPK